MHSSFPDAIVFQINYTFLLMGRVRVWSDKQYFQVKKNLQIKG